MDSSNMLDARKGKINLRELIFGRKRLDLPPDFLIGMDANRYYYGFYFFPKEGAGS